MTKMHRGKKAAASLMAGILLCQMFVFGVSKTSADAREVAKKMSFEVVGEGIVTVTDTAERTQEITSGSVIEVPKGMCVRVQAESPKETDIAVHVLDKDGNYELEDVSEVQGKCFWRDVTAMELEKKVVVTFGKEDKKIRAVRTGQTRGNYNKPEAGDVFTGNCVITAVDGGNGHTVHSVTIGGFTGILAGVTATGGCADHTAAAPYVGQEYTYRYTVTGVNKVTGEVMGNLYCTSVTGATDGVTKDSDGRLIGYQRISGSALIYRNYSGYAKLKKGKTQTMLTNGNPQYSLEDACYGIYKDRSATNEAATFTTDKEGNSNTVELEEGTYYVKEKKAPKGYRLDETVYPVTVVSGQTVSVNVKDVPVYSDMELILEKIDQEYKAGKSHGAGSLEGAEFTVCYYAGIYDQATLPKTPDRTWVLKSKKEKESYESRLNKDYQISGDDFYYAEDGKIPVLPLGTISIEETKAPEGYLTDGVKAIEFSITENGKIVDLTDESHFIYNQIKRGDLEGVKIGVGTHKRLANVPFKITSKTTGESHIVVTDKNGQFSTVSDWASHKKNTNVGKTSEDGIWFGTSEPDDSKGALLYDTYEIEELACESNKGMKLIPAFEVVVSRNKVTIDLGTLTDEYEKEITIHTTATDKETGEKIIVAGKKVTIVDTVTLDGLEEGRKYQLKGWQMLKEENAELLIDGKHVESDYTFVADSEKMKVEVSYTFDASELGGQNLVTFEELYDLKNPEEPVKVAEHKDIDDEGQTVLITERKISIHTTATDKNGKKEIEAGKDLTIVDTVTLEGLEIGTKYKLSGWQMIKEENAKLIIDGKEVTNDYEFTADKENMEVQIEFTFDGSTLGRKQLVTFEELYDITNLEEPKKVTEHKDINDEGQTVTIKEVLETPTPETPGTTTKTSNSPKTGDTANAILWIAILVLSAAGITGVRIWNKKKQVKRLGIEEKKEEEE